MISAQIREIGGLWCGAAIENNKIQATTFACDESSALANLAKEMPRGADLHLARDIDPSAVEVLEAIRRAHDGEEFSFDLPLAITRLSKYTQRALRAAKQIPTGYVATYGALARAAGGSPRSIGRAMASNPFPPLVPCHRVVASDMTLGGYGLGLAAKWSILRKESRDYERPLVQQICSRSLQLFPISMLKPGETLMPRAHH